MLSMNNQHLGSKALLGYDKTIFLASKIHVSQFFQPFSDFGSFLSYLITTVNYASDGL